MYILPGLLQLTQGLTRELNHLPGNAVYLVNYPVKFRISIFM